MRAYRAVLVLLSVLSVGHLSHVHGFKMNPKVELPPLKDQRVLVIGASGDVGNLVSSLDTKALSVVHSSWWASIACCCRCCRTYIRWRTCVAYRRAVHVYVCKAPS